MNKDQKPQYEAPSKPYNTGMYDREEDQAALSIDLSKDSY